MLRARFFHVARTRALASAVGGRPSLTLEQQEMRGQVREKEERSAVQCRTSRSPGARRREGEERTQGADKGQARGTTSTTMSCTNALIEGRELGDLALMWLVLGHR